MSATRRKVAGAMGLALLCLAPSAGNIGSCGQEAEPLGAVPFLTRKASIDCASCADCGLTTQVCASACAAEVPEDAAFPEGCLPLVHDGEVCLDALGAASCDSYARYVADEGATIPTECNFCPLDDEGQPDTGEEGE